VSALDDLEDLPQRHGGRPDDDGDDERVAERPLREALHGAGLVAVLRGPAERDACDQIGEQQMDDAVADETGAGETLEPGFTGGACFGADRRHATQ
jgi:hypothetical protein